MDRGALFVPDAYKAVEGADLMVLVTEWDEFLALDFSRIKEIMSEKNIIDGRNFLDKKMLRELGYKYMGIGN